MMILPIFGILTYPKLIISMTMLYVQGWTCEEVRELVVAGAGVGAGLATIGLVGAGVGIGMHLESIGLIPSLNPPACNGRWDHMK
jgi:hypothetical protein